MIPRPSYMAWLERWRNHDVIKVVTGLRRCGKSSVLKLFCQKLLDKGVEPERIQSINFESMDEPCPRDAQGLYSYIVSRLKPGMNYVILDEVQHVVDFERAVDGLFVREDIDLYITGSNAYFLSGEIATLLTGRYVELHMMPLSFKEFCSAFPKESPDALLSRYLLNGGMPFLLKLDDDKAVVDYLEGVFNTIIMHDAIARHPRMNMRAFRATTAFLADNIGNLTSLNKISRGLTALSSKTSPATVGEYVDALKENYLLFEAGRYDVRGKEHLETLGKFYLGDLGFRRWLLGKADPDIGRQLENVVYLELLRRFTHVSVGKLGEKEVDFVAMLDGSRTYVQVSLSVLDEGTLKRELTPLREIRDNYPKLLLTLDRIGATNHDGIEQRNVVDWLLED